MHPNANPHASLPCTLPLHSLQSHLMPAAPCIHPGPSTSLMWLKASVYMEVNMVKMAWVSMAKVRLARCHAHLNTCRLLLTCRLTCGCSVLANHCQVAANAKSMRLASGQRSILTFKDMRSQLSSICALSSSERRPAVLQEA